MALLYEEDLMPFFGNPNIQRQGARARALAAQRDVNTLPDPRTYAAVSGLLGTAPDQMGFSVLNPDYEGIQSVARPAYGLGLAAQVAPLIAPLTRGLPVGASIKNLGFDPVKMRTQYPDRLPPVLAFDKIKQKEYLAKQLSPEAKLVQKASTAAQRDIEKGNYTPYFDVSKRFFADPAKYNLQGETLTQALPAKAETIAKYKAMYDTPESRKKLSKAYEAGRLDPNAENWYAMGQLEEEYIKRLGAKKGAARFKDDFADAMAATTGGADPTSNFLMGSYGNYLREQGTAIPKNAYDLPYPIGGRFASGNMAMYDKVINQGAGLSAKETPKRFDFSANFLGDMNRATIDEQMMTGIYPALKAPAGDSYGVAEQVVNDLATQYGVKPGNFQDVTWKGLKGVPGMPMMEHINQSIERTARITNQTPQQVLDAFIRKRAPMYSAAPFGLLGFTPEEDQ
jgi:hypothetical protein